MGLESAVDRHGLPSKVPCAVALLHEVTPPRPAPRAGPSPPCKVNCDYAVGAAFLYILCEYFARCTEPVAFFATGGGSTAVVCMAVDGTCAASCLAIALLTCCPCAAHACMLPVLQGAATHSTACSSKADAISEPPLTLDAGMWMVRPKPIACGYIKAAVYMLVKLILVRTQQDLHCATFFWPCAVIAAAAAPFPLLVLPLPPPPPLACLVL